MNTRWTHADRKHTHADCPQKWTDADKECGHRTSFGGFLVVVGSRRGDARINFADTADNCGQKVWTDADCLQ